jgi:pseudouridine kinase
MKKCLVLGGTNIDIVGYSNNKIIKNDSNPGSVKFSYGGVGRNIAVNMKKMGLDVNMITAFGNDSFKDLLVEDFKTFQIDIAQSVFSQKYPSSIYLCVLDQDKDMDLAINSMDVIHEIDDIDFLSSKLEFINEHDYVLVDGNLSVEALDYLICEIKGKVIVDGVSSIKVVKFKNVLDCIDVLKVNRIEAAALLGISINTEEEIIEAGKKLMAKGVKQVFITDGANGSYAFDEKEAQAFRVEIDQIVNATGGGDTFTAGVVYGLANEFSLSDTLKFASIAATYTLKSDKTISDDLNVTEILNEIER